MRCRQARVQAAHHSSVPVAEHVLVVLEVVLRAGWVAPLRQKLPQSGLAVRCSISSASLALELLHMVKSRQLQQQDEGAIQQQAQRTSSHSPVVSGMDSSSIVVTTSTKGTPANKDRLSPCCCSCALHADKKREKAREKGEKMLEKIQ